MKWSTMPKYNVMGIIYLDHIKDIYLEQIKHDWYMYYYSIKSKYQHHEHVK